jgi:large subunit ribosomal protein L18
LYAQIIDDTKGHTLLAGDTRTIQGKTARDRAHAFGVALAEQAKKKGIEKVVFDRGGFLFAGTIRTFADSLREGGLIF